VHSGSADFAIASSASAVASSSAAALAAAATATATTFAPPAANRYAVPKLVCSPSLAAFDKVHVPGVQWLRRLWAALAIPPSPTATLAAATTAPSTSAVIAIAAPASDRQAVPKLVCDPSLAAFEKVHVPGVQWLRRLCAIHDISAPPRTPIIATPTSAAVVTAPTSAVVVTAPTASTAAADYAVPKLVFDPSCAAFEKVHVPGVQWLRRLCATHDISASPRTPIIAAPTSAAVVTAPTSAVVVTAPTASPRHDL